MKKAHWIPKMIVLALVSGLLSSCSFSFAFSTSFSSTTLVTSSSTTVSSSSANSTASSIISANSASSLPFALQSSYDFRIAEAYVPSAASAPVYALSKTSSGYVGAKAKTISREQDCLTYEDVAAYYAAFKAIPPNYFGDEDEAMAYGKNGRLVSTYYSGSHHSYDYTVKLGTFNQPSGGAYYEFDIDLTGYYNTGSHINRGAGRVVTVVDGITSYGSDPVSYYTEDHYADFKEYYNFYQGWSPLFAGVYNASGNYSNTPTSTLSRPNVPTVTYQVI